MLEFEETVGEFFDRNDPYFQELNDPVVDVPDSSAYLSKLVDETFAAYWLSLDQADFLTEQYRNAIKGHPFFGALLPEQGQLSQMAALKRHGWEPQEIFQDKIKDLDLDELIYLKQLIGIKKDADASDLALTEGHDFFVATRGFYQTATRLPLQATGAYPHIFESEKREGLMDATGYEAYCMPILRNTLNRGIFIESLLRRIDARINELKPWA